MTTITPAPTIPETDPKQLRKVQSVISGRTFATLATTSSAGRPHVAGVLYDEVDGALWVHTMRSSRKARSIAANPHVAVCIPFRKLPAGPPYTVQFQATAGLVDMDDPAVVDLIATGELTAVSGHGALDEPDGVFVRIVPNGTVHSYGLGANPVDLIRDPLHTGARTVHLGAAEGQR
jgi:general stress protein 26